MSRTRRAASVAALVALACFALAAAGDVYFRQGWSASWYATVDGEREFIDRTTEHRVAFPNVHRPLARYVQGWPFERLERPTALPTIDAELRATITVPAGSPRYLGADVSREAEIEVDGEPADETPVQAGVHALRVHWTARTRAYTRTQRFPESAHFELRWGPSPDALSPVPRSALTPAAGAWDTARTAYVDRRPRRCPPLRPRRVLRRPHRGRASPPPPLGRLLHPRPRPARDRATGSSTTTSCPSSARTRTSSSRRGTAGRSSRTEPPGAGRSGRTSTAAGCSTPRCASSARCGRSSAPTSSTRRCSTCWSGPPRTSAAPHHWLDAKLSHTRLVPIALSALELALMIAIGRRLFPRSPAPWLGALIYAVLPDHRVADPRDQRGGAPRPAGARDGVFFLKWRDDGRKTRHLVLAAICAGLAPIAKVPGIVWVPTLVMLVAAERGETKRAVWAALLGLGVASLLAWSSAPRSTGARSSSPRRSRGRGRPTGTSSRASSTRP